MNWSIMSFGKYKGKTLPLTVFRDPDWFFWACANNIFKGSLLTEAEHLSLRARSIKVPQTKDGETLVAEYAMRRTGAFCGLEIVPQSRVRHAGTQTSRSPVIDLSYPRSCKTYDKSGSRRIVREVKYILFGNASARMTADRAATFFDDDANFDLASPYRD